LIVVVFIVQAYASSSKIEWGVAVSYLFNPKLISGLWFTIFLTVFSELIGIAGGVLLAVMRLSPNRVLKAIAGGYVWLFRGTPVLIQIILWYNIALVFPRIGIGSFSLNSNDVFTPTFAALIALGLNEAAYMSEIVRGGILSVDPGQNAAAVSIGMRGSQSMRFIVLPQAIRSIIPAMGNQFIGMLKTTSLVSVIAYTELLYSVQLIYAANYKQIPLLIVASIWYLVVTSVLSVGQYYLERRFGRGTSREPPDTPWQRIRRNLFTFRHARVAAPDASGEGR
jgi:polar amino acid transport system permease protein